MSEFIDIEHPDPAVGDARVPERALAALAQSGWRRKRSARPPARTVRSKPALRPSQPAGLPESPKED